MLVYVDESGDPGMRFKAGSSDIFVIAAVLFANQDAANECDARIERHRSSIGFRKGIEFHFNKCARSVRLGFLQEVAQSDFKYFSFALNKAQFNRPRLCLSEILLQGAGQVCLSECHEASLPRHGGF